MKKLVWLSLMCAVGLYARLEVEKDFPAITLPDQFEKQHTISKDQKIIIMAFEKDISVAVNDFLKEKPSGYLDEHHAKYISDISSMPSVITWMFAMPKMKKYPFSLMLINDDSGKQFDREAGKITVYRLREQEIRSIEFISPKDIASIFKE